MLAETQKARRKPLWRVAVNKQLPSLCQRQACQRNASNMTPIPKPEIDIAVETLSDRDEFKVIVQFIRDEREKFFGDLRMCESSNDVMKIAGSVAALDELLSVLS